MSAGRGIVSKAWPWSQGMFCGAMKRKVLFPFAALPCAFPCCSDSDGE